MSHQGCYRSSRTVTNATIWNSSLFSNCHGHHFSWLQMARVHWEQEHWEEDIDLQLAETAHIKHTRRSVSDFMNNINSWETSSNSRNKDLQFITDIVDANKKDSEDGCEYNWNSRPGGCGKYQYFKKKIEVLFLYGSL